MALNGRRTAEDKRSRLVKTTRGFVTVVKCNIEDYDVWQDGVRIGRVTKFRHWYAEAAESHPERGNGSRWPKQTRQAAIEWLMKWCQLVTPNDQASGGGGTPLPLQAPVGIEED
jgi:hypothetical protein